MTAPPPAIPFEPQSDPQIARDCGAACLSMVYRSFGKPIPRAEIWPAVSGKNRAGSISSLTHLMVKDAVARGFVAVAVQAKHPLQALRLCQESGIRAILSHRLARDAAAGHYTVLIGIDNNEVVVHDPYHGPARHLPHAELMDLWQPRPGSPEVMGGILIGIAEKPSAADACWLCRAPLPAVIACPHCKQPVGLQPNSFLNCIDTACVARMWNYVCCPSCDCGFTVTPAPKGAAAASSVVAEPAQSAKPAGSGVELPQLPLASAESLNLDPFFAEIDKFSAAILALPAAAAHPAIQRHLAKLTDAKQALTLARAEALINQKASMDQWSKTVEDSNQAAEAHRQKMEELNRPSTPLDGNALGRALMANLGFTKQQ